MEILITIVLITAGIFAVTRGFSVGLLAAGDAENTRLALDIAEAKMEEVKNTPFANLSDTGPSPDPSFPNFNVKTDISEGQNPMPVAVTISWQAKSGQTSIDLTTLVANY